MKLISCKDCAVVLDGDVLIFPDNYYDEIRDCHDENVSGYSEMQENWVAKVQCPVCQADILEGDN